MSLLLNKYVIGGLVLLAIYGGTVAKYKIEINRLHDQITQLENEKIELGNRLNLEKARTTDLAQQFAAEQVARVKVEKDRDRLAQTVQDQNAQIMGLKARALQAEVMANQKAAEALLAGERERRAIDNLAHGYEVMNSWFRDKFGFGS